jgi:hypothetical protein
MQREFLKRNTTEPTLAHPPEDFQFNWLAQSGSFTWREASLNLYPNPWQDSAELSPLQSDFLLIPPSPERRLRVYRPLEDVPELFDTFSRLNSKDEISEFAGKFGQIGLQNYDARLCSQGFELLSSWRRHIDLMRATIGVFDLNAAADSKEIASLIRWQGNTAFFCCRIEGDRLIGCPQPDKGTLSMVLSDNALRAGDYDHAAQVFLSRVIDLSLKKQVSPRLVSLGTGKKMRPYFYPSSLLAAMWLQVYWMILGETRFRRCDICQRRMDVTENRTNKRVHKSCSDREKMQRYYRSKTAGVKKTRIR